MRNNRMNRITPSGRRGPGRQRYLRTDFSEDYDTSDFADGSEDNWDNEGGTFANPDPDFDDDYDDDFQAGYDEAVPGEFDDELYDDDDDWDDDEFEYDGGYAEDDDDIDYNQRRRLRGEAREGSYGGGSGLRRQMMLRYPRRTYDNRPSSMSRVRHSGISISGTGNRKSSNRKRNSGFDNRRRYDW
jgi:hypothetical protein